jgi:hypothetical protein
MMRSDVEVMAKARIERVPEKNWPARLISERYRIV